MEPSGRRATEPIRHVAAGQGLTWIGDALRWLFASARILFLWMAMGLVWWVIAAMLHLVPVLGQIASLPVNFLLLGGLMRAAQHTARGPAPRFDDLFSGFGAPAGALIALGVLALLGTIATFGLLLAAGLGAFFSFLATVYSDPYALTDRASQLSAALGGASLGMLLAALVLLMLLWMALWLAPALVVLQAIPPVQAMGLSFRASLRNAGAVTLLGVAFLGVAVVAILLPIIGWLLLPPLMVLTTYAAYAEIFEPAGEVLDAGPMLGG